MASLSVSSVMRFIKRRLGVPALSLELNDETIKDIIIEDTLPVFTEYVPDIGNVLINREDKNNLVNEREQNLFWVRDKDSLRVLDIVDVIPEHGALIASGYPYLNLPYTSYESIDDIALSISETESKNMFSKADITWEQVRDINQIRIYGENSLSNLYVVFYTREHSEDLSTIPIRLESEFKDLCLAFTMITIGNIRKTYSGIETPVGTLNISSEIYEEGISLRDKVLEVLKIQEPPITPIYIG